MDSSLNNILMTAIVNYVDNPKRYQRVYDKVTRAFPDSVQRWVLLTEHPEQPGMNLLLAAYPIHKVPYDEASGILTSFYDRRFPDSPLGTHRITLEWEDDI